MILLAQLKKPQLLFTQLYKMDASSHMATIQNLYHNFVLQNIPAPGHNVFCYNKQTTGNNVIVTSVVEKVHIEINMLIL